MAGAQIKPIFSKINQQIIENFKAILPEGLLFYSSLYHIYIKSWDEKQGSLKLVLTPTCISLTLRYQESQQQVPVYVLMQPTVWLVIKSYLFQVMLNNHQLLSPL